MPDRLVPRSGPYQSGLPCAFTGPCQIFVITAASCCVMTPQGVMTPTRVSGFQLHADGFMMTPPAEPHAFTAASVNATSLQVGRKSPDSFITSWGQMSAGMNCG